MFLTPVRLLIAKWGENFPRAAQRWPYDLMLSIARYRVQAACPTASVWERNSLALDHWIFAVSDVDLSIWVNGDAREAQKAWVAIKTGARWNLLGGEIHIYSGQVINSFLPFCNPWELARDPILQHRIQPQQREASPAQTLAYYVHQLVADQALINHPEARRGKWERYFKARRISFPEPFTLQTLVERLIESEVFSAFQPSDVMTAIIYREGPPPLMRLLFPNQHVWGDKEVELDRLFMRELAPAGRDYLEAMVEWEIWGLSPFTLMTAGFSLKSLRGHWINQTDMLKMLTISDERKARLLKGMADLLNYYEVLESDDSVHP